MGILTHKWLTKPSWGDYTTLMIGWGVLFGWGIMAVIFTSEDRSVWLSVLYYYM